MIDDCTYSRQCRRFRESLHDQTMGMTASALRHLRALNQTAWRPSQAPAFFILGESCPYCHLVALRKGLVLNSTCGSSAGFCADPRNAMSKNPQSPPTSRLSDSGLCQPISFQISNMRDLHQMLQEHSPILGDGQIDLLSCPFIATPPSLHKAHEPGVSGKHQRPPHATSGASARVGQSQLHVAKGAVT